MNQKINQITILISQIQHARNGEITLAQEWMMSYVKDSQLKETISKLTIVSYHILDLLQDHNELTGIKLAEYLGVTRGGVTRAAKKMQNQGLIKTARHEDNKKNIYYQITPQGEKIAKLHATMHNELYLQLQQKIENEFSDAELDSILRFLKYIKEDIMK